MLVMIVLAQVANLKLEQNKRTILKKINEMSEQEIDLLNKLKNVI